MSIHFVDDFVETHRETYQRLSDNVWQFAELGYEEIDSSRAHIEQLKRAGFTVREGVAGIPTAFVAEAGEGGPIIGILGEFDALSGLSQQSQAVCCQPSSEITNGNGHGCGHHLLGTSAHLAAVAVKDYLRQHGLPGTVRFYGCPAEEGGYGKTYMARAGLFDDLDAALTWHPGVVNGVMNLEALACKTVYFRFTGISAHAGASPHLGRSALDAVELTNVGSNYLREHMLSDARVHYAITNAGGVAPNVVQPNAEVMYMIRAANNQDVSELYERVCAIAQGAAMMTGCTLEIALHSACSNIVLNTVLNELMHEKLTTLGVPKYDDTELGFAAAIHDTVSKQEVAMSNKMLQAAWRDPKPLYDIVEPLNSQKALRMHGSTDVGDVSWVTPTAQCMTACFAFGSSPHSWQWVSQGKSKIAHKGMLYAAKAIAASALELFANPALLAAAKAEHAARLEGTPYVCPIPEGVNPPLPAKAAA